MRGLVIGGAASGVGKTTVACALLAAFRHRGRRVQPFKVGPDYIDPGHHAAAAGVASRNVDTVLVPPRVAQDLFARAAARCDIAIVEGVMGLFDGRNRTTGAGSTAEVGRLMGLPVVVVLDVSRIARTAGAIALGCTRFDPDLNVAGFILNRVSSPDHAATAREAVESATGLPVFGALRRDPAIELPERHLGLVPAAEQEIDGVVDRLAALAERELDLDGLWAVSGQADPTAIGASMPVPADPRPRAAGIAVARDAAFSFYYEDSLDLLVDAGAELLPFSPLADQALPHGTQGVYLGGGFPELFAAELAANASMRAAMQTAAHTGLPMYGECGGLMYLGDSLIDFDGVDHRMAGVVPLRSVMSRERVTLGYRTARALRPSPLLDTGQQITGHEFHYSVLDAQVPEATAAYHLAEPDTHEGYARGNVLASYVHVHFGASPGLARRFVEHCAQVQPLR